MSGAEELSVGGRAVRVSHPEKVYFPARGLTKGEVVEYYLAVGDGILRALRDRPTMLERHPGGVEGKSFYQKRVPAGAPPWVERVAVTFPSGRAAEEVCPTELAVVAWAANLGTLTFHPWPVHRRDPDRPDQLRLDLDPQPGTGFADAVSIARELRAVLGELGLSGFPKTSGGRGLHVFVPVEPRWEFHEVRRAVIALGRELERRRPDDVTLSWWKEERGRRIFLDYNQTARDRTMASAYSIRARPQAPVSAPVAWDELDAVHPDELDPPAVAARFAAAGDLHAGMAGAAGTLDELLEWSERDRRDRGLGDLPYPPDFPKQPGEPPRVQPSRARRSPDG